MMIIESKDNEELIQRWFDNEVEGGENSILVYPDLQTFRQIYTNYVKDKLAKKIEEEKEDDNNSKGNEQSKSRIILIATFYDTVNAVKHNLSAVGVDVQSRIDDGSLLIVDAFNGYSPDINGIKKLVTSLSKRAVREGRIGVSVIVNMGFFFLYDGDGEASNLIKYEASLAPKTDGGNVRGISCYHLEDYNTLNDSQKKELQGHGQKKLLDVTESAAVGTLAIHS